MARLVKSGPLPQTAKNQPIICPEDGGREL